MSRAAGFVRLAALARARAVGVRELARVQLSTALRRGSAPATPVDDRIVVSLTTYRARLPWVHRTLQSLLTQQLRPESLVLVLSSDEFGGTDHELPVPLRRLIDSGQVRLLWTPENTRSYKKLLPTLAEYPHRTVVTADDDVLYPPSWLRELVDAHGRMPGRVICHRATEMRRGADGLEPYLSWPPASHETPDEVVFPTGVGGVLYPPDSLDPRVADVETALSLCPTADDVWFKTMALLRGTGAALAAARPPADFPLSRLRDGYSESLAAVNVGDGANDRQLAAVTAAFADELAPSVLGPR